MKGCTERHLESESGSFIDGPSPDLNGWRELRTFEDDLLPGGNALAAEFYLMEHDREQAARILADARLESGLGRAHAWAARIALLLERGRGSQ